MRRSWYPVLSALIVALLLAGCTLNNTPEATPTPPLGATAAPATAAATPGAPEITETLPPAETSAATAVLTGTPSLSPGPIFQPGLLQAESIIVNATGEIQPSTISATTGLTLAITLLNRNEADALLAFDLSPSGAATILVPGTLTGTGQPPGLNTTATPLDQTPETSPTPTPRLLLPPTTGAISATSAPETATPTPLIETPVISGSIQVIYLRYDQPGTYFVRCIADASGQTGGQSACSGSVTIVVTPPTASPTEVVPPPATTTGTPLGGTAVVTGTAALTSTSGTTATSAPAGTGTSAPATIATTATAQATTAATTGPTTAP